MSAIVLALGLSGAGAAPFIMQSASASVVAADPVEPCDVGEVCDLDPPEDVTVTVTTTVGQPPPPEEDQEAPATTVTTTVTASPEPTTTKTVTATPTKSTSTPTEKPSTPATTQAPPSQPLPTQPDIQVPPVTPTSSTPTAEASVEMPTVAPTDPVTTAPPPSQSQAASTEEVPLELRQAAPEYDQRTLTGKLAIPALVMVLLALFGVLIFEGRLRRMAHAAAMRKAGPQLPPDVPPMPPGGYPAGPAYATAHIAAPGYPGGTAYAPIISFVPVQTFPSTPPPGYQDPHQPYPHGYAQEPAPYAEPPQEPVVLGPEQFDSYSEPPKSRERDLFEPAIPPEPPASDIPPGGAGPFDPDKDQPLGPASAAEAGDSEPWQQHQRGLFEPAKEYEPPPYLPADVPAGEATAVQPVPPQPGSGPQAQAGEQQDAQQQETQQQEAQQQDATRVMPGGSGAKRRLFGRKKK
ncbi:hypothetical protein [Nonomuraea sp. NPDC049309]|uniref:hypothetical protein n=1 Tax=Nonomuraea sp. NPDC049309 TaxID=3364350 RepID=UPI00371A0B2B